MFCFFKNINTFETFGQAVVSEYSVTIASANGNTGSVTVVGELTQDYTGHWLILGDNLLFITAVQPADKMTTITVYDALKAFSRSIAYTEPTATYLGEYIQDLLESEYINQQDDYYDMPYLSVSNSDTTGFAHIAPNKGVISVESVMRDAQSKGVVLSFTFTESALALAISTGSTTRQVVVMGDGHSQLLEETYNSKLISKVTVISEALVPHNYYMTLAGEIVTEPPVNRAPGEWVTVKQTQYNLLDTATNAFAASSESHKISFMSTLALDLYTPLLIRLEGKTYEASVTYIAISSNDNRIEYHCGDAVTTLTGQVAALNRATAQVSDTIPYAVSQIANDVPFAALNLATRIPANSDLNNYTEPGNYYVLDSTDAQSIAHSPQTVVGYRLWVVRMTSTYYTQIALPNSTTPRLYTRRFQSGVFSAWARFMLDGEALPVQPASETITFSAISPVGFGHASTATAVRLFVPIPNNATSASVSTTGTWTLGTTGGTVSVSGLSVYQVTRAGVYLSGTASGLTSGTPVELKCAAGSSITFEWS